MANKIQKQDVTLPRTAIDLQEQYRFGKTFGELIGLKDDTRKISVKVSVVVDDDGDIKADEIVRAIEAGKIKMTAECIEFNGSASFENAVKGEVGKTEISGSKIKTGAIQSTGYVKDKKGLKIDLDLGTLDAKNFKVDKDGNVILSGCLDFPYNSDGMTGYIGKKDGKIGMLISIYGNPLISTEENEDGTVSLLLHSEFTKFQAPGYRYAEVGEIIDMLEEWQDFKGKNAFLFQ